MDGVRWSTQTKERQDGQDDDDESDKINDTAHLGGPFMVTQ